MRNHIYNRRKPVPLPLHQMLRPKAAVLPAVVDLRPWLGPVKNQGDLGSCTGHAGAEAGEWIYRKYFNLAPIFSPLYLYAKELIANGDFPQDEGSDGTTLCEVAITNGFCEDSLYPDSSQVIQAPTPAMDANAGTHKLVGAYHGLSGSAVAQSVLGDSTPWPVEMGFAVYDSFESDAVTTTGIYNPNTTTESVLGGHEVPVVGYDLGATPTLRPANCPPAFLVRNSWGTGWGWNGSGDFWAVVSVLDDPDTDLKVFHAGGPWA